MSESSKDDGLEEFFGIWADRNIDGLEYQLRIRSEWDERERDFEEAFARLRAGRSNEDSLDLIEELNTSHGPKDLES